MFTLPTSPSCYVSMKCKCSESFNIVLALLYVKLGKTKTSAKYQMKGPRTATVKERLQ